MNAAELSKVLGWVKPGSRVLDLGCGDGRLLARLRDERQVQGYGLEIDIDNVRRCVATGVNVIQADLDAGLDAFDTDAFDTVILLETLQAVRYPAHLLEAMLRVGREGVVTFPNFAHWRARLQVGLGGGMPVTPALPSQWHDTENIHLCTIADFERLCRERSVQIVERVVMDSNRKEGRLSRCWPALFGETALYRVRRENRLLKAAPRRNPSPAERGH